MKIITEKNHVTLADVIDELAEEFEDKRIINEREEAAKNIPDSNPFKKLFALFTPERKPIQTSDEKKKAEKGGIIYG
jgi:hypothetical protein